jgi:hypothetical protein
MLLYAAGLDDQNAKKLSDARQTVKKVHCSIVVTSEISDTRGGQHRRRQRKRQRQRRSQKGVCSDELCIHILQPRKTRTPRRNKTFEDATDGVRQLLDRIEEASWGR